MLKSKKTNLLIAFLLCAITFDNTHAMEPASTENVPKWALFVGGVLLGAVAIRSLTSPSKGNMEPFLQFSELPKDLQNQIISYLTINNSTESLEIAAKTISSLAQVNKELNTMINKPEFCLKLIKNLSKRFNYSNQTVAEKLQISSAKKQLALQIALFNVCKQSNLADINTLRGLYIEGADLEFTYSKEKLEDLAKYYAETNPYFPKDITLLMLITLLNNEANPNTALWNFFLEKHVDINGTNNAGTTVLMFTCSNNLAIERLLKISGININQQDLEGNTALMYSISKNVSFSYDDDFKKEGGIMFMFFTLEDLINAGADPEISNFAGLTPLQALLQLPNQENEFIQDSIMLIKDAITNKRAEQK